MIRIGLDLGGTKIEIVALDEAGAELVRRRTPTPPGGYDAIIAEIVCLVRDVERGLGETGSIGIGTPGSASPATGLLQGSNTACLNGKRLHLDLEKALERDVAFANDANCFALSEAVDGGGQDANVVFGVILGTGVGGGMVVRGRLWEGASGIAGEWGHNPMPWPSDEERAGPPCYCGKPGCVETFLSGPGFERDHARLAGAAMRSEAIVEKARSGDPAASATLARYTERLGRALAHVINVLDPDVVVLGGGMSNVVSLERVRAAWAGWVFSDKAATRVVKAVHGDSSGVRGAAWLPRLDR